jgi:hypothetical protein
MDPKNDLPHLSWRVLWRAPVRALFVGALAAVVAGFFGAVGGSILAFFGGAPWVCVSSWSMRGAAAGLAAGAIVGALSGVYHVEKHALQTRSFRPSNRPARKVHQTAGTREF